MILYRWTSSSPRILLGWAPLFFASILPLLVHGQSRGEEIVFARDIRPILATRCLECHSQQAAKGDLILSSREGAFVEGPSGQPAIVPGRSEQSALISRITSRDPDLRMPPQGPSLTDSEVKMLQRWIDSGAAWPDRKEHWSYLPPRAPSFSLNHSQDPPLSHHPIDRMVIDRLAQQNRFPSKTATPEVLVRRMTLDLIGLPPTLDEVSDFAFAWHENEEEGARQHLVERLADRLLASPQFGVRWARPWLDLARYADSHGFQRDDLRDLWLYRDWVIDSLNADKPFDAFTLEQLAGDLIPNATDQHWIATGFNRCTTCNVEAGTEPEENRINQVFDRVNTLGAVWLGTTLECAQCHDHKYDPVTMRDYYRLFAFFNNTSLEADRSNPDVPGSIKFNGPYRSIEDPKLRTIRQDLEGRRSELQGKLKAIEARLAADRSAWEETLRRRIRSGPTEQPAIIQSFESLSGSAHQILPDQSVLISDDNTPPSDTYTLLATSEASNIRAIKIEALTDPSLPGKGPGRGDAERPNFVLSAFLAKVATEDDRTWKGVSFSSAKASHSQNNLDVSQLLTSSKNARKSGWAIGPEFHRSHWAVLELETPLRFEKGSKWEFQLVQNFGGGRTIGKLRISMLQGESSEEPLSDEIVRIVAKEPSVRTAKETQILVDFHHTSDSSHQELRRQINRIDDEINKRKSPQTLVMKEISAPRSSYVFARGDYRNPTERVEPGVPEFLHSPRLEMTNRLDLARWLVSKENPLTARVVINRWWSEIFGRGLVATPEDFGLQGDYPSHPELLDWLAIEWMEHDWSMKAVLRAIVTSATYRQDGRLNQELKDHDDQNIFLGKGPRFRMDAEMIRDNALAIAGLLSRQQRGPSIRPPQPEGLWEKVGGEKYDYVVTPGEGKYRRGLYVVWKRGSPYPSLVNFDATARMTCTVKRSRSNTPLQALTLLNDPVYVEAADAFAKRIQEESETSDVRQRIRFAFRLAVARSPQEAEVELLHSLWMARALSTGPEEAWQSIATTLLNLDETITKP